MIKTADKRMFSKSIVLSDMFLDMPATTRCLYFTLSMFGDDDGFIDAPKGIMRQCGASDDDLKLLVAKKFIIPFDTGVVVIRHWRINNYLRGDRYTETKYVEEKSTLLIEQNGAYSEIEPEQPNLFQIPPEVIEEKVDEQKVESAKKVPLKEREPKNEIEKVEKEYLLNYDELHKAGCLNRPEPIINWAVSRKVTKDAIKKYGIDTVIEAVKKSKQNKFCIEKGYALTTILSAGVLAGLVNSCSRSPPKDLSNKFDMFEYVS